MENDQCLQREHQVSHLHFRPNLDLRGGRRHGCRRHHQWGGAVFQASDALLFGSSGTNASIATGSGSITLKADWIAFDGSETGPGSGQTTLSLTGVLKIEPYNANFRPEFLGGSDGAVGSELNWNGAVTEVTSGVFRFTGDASNDFRQLIIEDYTRLGGFILNKDNSVTPVDVETHVDVNGPITIYGGDVTLEVDLTSRLSGADILVKGSGKVEAIPSRSFLTNNGDIVFWGDRDANGEGSILLGDDLVLNSANGRTADTDSGGGQIVMGGGSNSGVVPSGNAASASLPGIKLGTTTANHTQIYSGGGNISLKGTSTATGLGDDRDEAGIYQWGRMTMKSGRGSITMQGVSSQYQGIGFIAPVSDTDSGTKQLVMSSAKTSGTAIQLTGTSTSGHGISFNHLNPKEILSLGGGRSRSPVRAVVRTGYLCRTKTFFPQPVTSISTVARVAWLWATGACVSGAGRDQGSPATART